MAGQLARVTAPVLKSRSTYACRERMASSGDPVSSSGGMGVLFYALPLTSMTAPVASGWSGCRVGLAPTGKRRLVTAHT
jgi:hypothetical protein